MEFESVVKSICDRWPFDRENYPRLPENIPERTLFAIAHIVRHQAESVGAVFGQLEEADHGRAISPAVFEEEAVKMFRNAVRLADAIGLDAGQLAMQACSTNP